MRNIILTIMVTLLTACSGAAFEADFQDLGGDAGAPDVTVGGGTVTAGTGGRAGVSAGGSSSTGGKTGIAGSVASAGSAAGVSGAGTGGAAPATCDFDPAKLTAALPRSLTWQTFTVASGNVCAYCAYEPCGKLQVTWGAPTASAAGAEYTSKLTPTGAPQMAVQVAKNDGICAEQLSCLVKPADLSVSFTVARNGSGWSVTAVAAHVGFVDDECTTGLGAPGELIGLMAADLGDEISGALKGLKFPCK